MYMRVTVYVACSVIAQSVDEYESLDMNWLYVRVSFQPECGSDVLCL